MKIGNYSAPISIPLKLHLDVASRQRNFQKYRHSCKHDSDSGYSEFASLLPHECKLLRIYIQIALALNSYQIVKFNQIFMKFIKYCVTFLC